MAGLPRARTNHDSGMEGEVIGCLGVGYWVLNGRLMLLGVVAGVSCERGEERQRELRERGKGGFREREVVGKRGGRQDRQADTHHCNGGPARVYMYMSRLVCKTEELCGSVSIGRSACMSGRGEVERK